MTWSLKKSLLLIKFIQILGALLGDIFFYCIPVRRKIILENLTRAYLLQKTPKEIKALARKNVEHYGKMLFEIFYLRNQRQLKCHTGVIGQEVIQKALSQGKGIILLGLHLGNWEVMVRSFFMIGEPVHVVAREIKSSWINYVVEKLRSQSGLTFISVEHSYRALLSLLRQNKIIGLVLDQHKNAKNRALYVEFFNRPAATSTAIASLALTSGAAVIPAYHYRKPDGSFGLVFESPLELKKTGNLEEDIFYNTQLFTKKLEAIIRQYPEQWFWAHQRWKGTVPPWQTIKPVFKIA